MSSKRMDEYNIKYGNPRPDSGFIRQEERYQHPLYKTNDKENAIRKDMEAHGFDNSNPIITDCEGFVLAGHTRHRIAKELGLQPRFLVKFFPGDEKGEAEVEKKLYAYRENLLHRQVSAADKKRIAADMLKLKPEMSDRMIAKDAHLSPTSVGKIRHALEKTEELPKVTERIGQDGKVQENQVSAMDTIPQNLAPCPSVLPPQGQEPVMDSFIAVLESMLLLECNDEIRQIIDETLKNTKIIKDFVKRRVQ